MEKAVLVVSFGVSNQEARKRTIDVCEQIIRQSLEEYGFYKAYTSIRIIEKSKNMKKLKLIRPLKP